MSVFEPITSKVHGFRRGALAVGAAALVISLLGAIFDLEQFFRSWLLAWLFWWGVVLGSLALLMLHHVVGGRWGFVSRRVLESAVTLIPLLAIFFAPLLVGLIFELHHLYAWAREGEIASDHALQHKAPYLNTPFFLARSILYFALWWWLGSLLNRWSGRSDLGEATTSRLPQLLSGPGLVLYGLTVTFAAVDWAMSLEAHWFSTAYGVLFIAGQLLAALAFAIVSLTLLARSEALAAALGKQHFHDLGNLLLAFVLIWSYVSFSHYLIIWSGNLAEEIPWYRDRTAGGWQAVALLLIVLHFAVPFVLLLWRRVKRSAATLATVAAGLFILRFVDLFWLVVPAFEPDALVIHWLDLATPLALGGLLSAAFLRQLEKRPLVPREPRFGEVKA